MKKKKRVRDLFCFREGKSETHPDQNYESKERPKVSGTVVKQSK